MSVVRGIVLARDGEDLVIRASDADVAQFAVHQAVLTAAVDAPPALGWTRVYADMMADGYLYDRTGRRVALIDKIDITTDTIDVTTFGSAVEYVSAGQRVRIQGRGPV